MELKRAVDRAEVRLEEANKSLAQMEAHIADMDKKFTTIEAGFRKLTGVKGPDVKAPSKEE
jgi:hypothetical protein